MKTIERRMIEACRTCQPLAEGPIRVLTRPDDHRYVVSVKGETIAFGIPGRLTIRPVELDSTMVSRINALLTLATDDEYELVRNPADNDWILAKGRNHVRVWKGDVTIKTNF